MDINIIRSLVTVLGLVLFLVLVARTWSKRRLQDHEDAAHQPFLDDAPRRVPTQGGRP